MKQLIVLIVLLSLIAPVFAVKNAVIVVAERGNDGFPGTFDKPVKTVHQALIIAKPGDRVIILIGDGKIEFKVDPDYRLIQIGFGKVGK